MDFIKIAKLIVKLIGDAKNINAKPGVSLIINRMLSSPALNKLLLSQFTLKEILQIGYMVFFILEGDDYTSAEWKSKNDLYILKVKEIGEMYNKEVPCQDCDATGYITCSECDGTREASCTYCDGTGEIYDDGSECPYCNGSGWYDCESCDAEGETICDTCSGNQEVESDEEYVFFNEENWVIGNPDTAQKLEDIREKKEITDEFYDILDKDKGSVFLLKTETETEYMEFNDFEYENGDYYELKGKYVIESVKNLKNSTYKFNIVDSSKNNLTIK